MTRPRRKTMLRSERGSGTAVRGFTLVELAVVVALVALLLAIAIPQLLPTILFSNLEGSARHLASYGRAAMAHAVMTRERLTIRIELTPEDGEPQQYWTVRWYSEDELREEKDEDGMFAGGTFGRVGGTSRNERAQDRNAALYQPGSQEDMAERARALQERFDRFAALSLQSKTRNVKHDGLLGKMGPLFGDKKFSLDSSGKEDDVEEVKTSLLERTRLPDGVEIESVRVGTSELSRGLVEVDVTPLGLAEPVHIYLKARDSRDYFTVAWDPITGGAHVYEGKEEPL
ncbi:MAG TPA: prepilin-type N-terminal cleavage/methylation domain-containing protein [Candidatus Hydrogenedentes bacterium]|nr:prepilin-type N-terminal cleavage/methylation domain-containing protein [Candidatus Hydrogenedentota bacterium]